MLALQLALAAFVPPARPAASISSRHASAAASDVRIHWRVASAAAATPPLAASRAPPPQMRSGSQAGPPHDVAFLESVKPTPNMEPHEVIAVMMSALHKSNLDRPRARFGCEVALRFLAPTNPASRASTQLFAQYLNQPWYQCLLDWSEYRMDGEVAILRDGKEAYQQIAVRSSPEAPWTSIRWILVRVPFYGSSDQWMVEAVFAQEPDDGSDLLVGAAPSAQEDARALALLNEQEQPRELVMKIMKAIRHLDEPYPLHGCEVAIRYCAPNNRASRLSPQAFAQYLREPWYRIMAEWDEIEIEDEPELLRKDGSVVQQDALVKRKGDDSWTVVNWQLSRHSGRWLTDALTITE
ncbi:hypothetical protein AB1Y20_004801 [Prymnesium parvum]|uniref:Uncharacterized protein n=1 Tax=Prymnesium parvum TaxID=97485 RepID=A0AB34IXJ8_PRYPA